MRPFLDTNVILDIPLGREGARASEQVLELCGETSHLVFTSWHTLSTISYILAKARDHQTAKAFIGGLLDLVEIGPASTALARHALALGIDDLEDAMQVAVAEAVAADIIVTRNLRDFSRSPVAAISPEDFLVRFKG
jgi:predicted nucleic acid-binding protein